MLRRLLRVTLLGVFVLVWTVPGYADFQAFPDLKKADDLVYSLLTKFKAGLYKFEVLDPVERGGNKVYPAMLNFWTCEPENLPDFLKEIDSFTEPELAMRPCSLVISQSSEIRPKDNKPILTCTLEFQLINGPTAQKAPPSLSVEFLAVVLEAIDFQPGVQRKARVEGINRWLTNLRVANDPKRGNEAQFTGFSFSRRDVFAVCKSLLESSSNRVANAAVYSLNSTTAMGLPIWRFDCSANNIPATLTPPAHFDALQSLSDACDTSGAVLSDIRMAPAISLETSREYPMELSFKEIDDARWEELKTKILAYQKDGCSFKETGGLSPSTSGGPCTARIALAISKAADK